MQEIYLFGADKIAINTASILNPKLITEIAQEFGTQSIVASIQAEDIQIMMNGLA